MVPGTVGTIMSTMLPRRAAAAVEGYTVMHQVPQGAPMKVETQPEKKLRTTNPALAVRIMATQDMPHPTARISTVLP